jgi:SAM-dependent methyltransferase
MPKRSRQEVDAAAWDVFARHQPYYHILSDPSMLSPGPDQQDEFWASGERDIASLQAFAELDFEEGAGVDLGCGLGRLTRGLRRLTSRQIGLDISSEMLRQAREANGAFSSMEFRQICEDYWPMETGSCVLIVSLHVLQHMSNLALIKHSITEMGRILAPGGKAVFNVPTTRWRGQLVHWVKSPWTKLNGRQEKQRLRVLEERLAQQSKVSTDFTEHEIMHDMFQLDCRRMKAIPLVSLRRAIKNAGLQLHRLQRSPDSGNSLVSAKKISADQCE